MMSQLYRRCCRRRRIDLAANAGEGTELLGGDDGEGRCSHSSRVTVVDQAWLTGELHDLRAETASLKFDRTNLKQQLEEAIQRQDVQAAETKRLRMALLTLVPSSHAGRMRSLPTAQLLNAVRDATDQIAQQQYNKAARAEEAQEAIEARAKVLQRQLSAAEAELGAFRQQQQAVVAEPEQHHRRQGEHAPLPHMEFDLNDEDLQQLRPSSEVHRVISGEGSMEVSRSGLPRT